MHCRLLIALALAAAAPLSAQMVYIGSLDGSSADSTMEGLSGGVSTTQGTTGWSTTSGSNTAQFFDGASNDVLIGSSDFADYTAQYTYAATAWSADTAYTFSMRTGYVSGPYTELGSITVTFGTWDGDAFTALDGGSITLSTNIDQNIASYADESPAFDDNQLSQIVTTGSSTTRFLTFTTPGSVSADAIAIQFLIENPGSVSLTHSDYLGIDNVTLGVSAVPEPSTYAAIFGGLALAGAAWQRRRRTAGKL